MDYIIYALIGLGVCAVGVELVSWIKDAREATKHERLWRQYYRFD